MKKTTLINGPLSAIIARMGHGDQLVIADCGLPIPLEKSLIDLAVTPGFPKLIDVLKVVLTELKVEKVIITNEMGERSPAFRKDLENILEEKIPEVPVDVISHEDLKTLTRTEKNIHFVRTGEATPFSNLILIAGVVF
jgi:D-ribose pyranase